MTQMITKQKNNNSRKYANNINTTPTKTNNSQKHQIDKYSSQNAKKQKRDYEYDGSPDLDSGSPDIDNESPNMENRSPLLGSDTESAENEAIRSQSGIQPEGIGGDQEKEREKERERGFLRKEDLYGSHNSSGLSKYS